jgi:hypothetical protein
VPRSRTVGLRWNANHRPTHARGGIAKSLSRQVFVGCSVSTEPADLTGFGAHRAPYETAEEASGTDSKSMGVSGLSSEGAARRGGSPFVRRVECTPILRRYENLQVCRLD